MATNAHDEEESEWTYMDTLRPPVYVCLRRKPSADGKFHPMALDGRYITTVLLFAWAQLVL